MSPIQQTIAILGCGTIGRAIASGLLDADMVSRRNLLATVRTEREAVALREDLDIHVSTDNVEVANRAEVVVLAVKPQNAAGVLRDRALRAALAGKVLVSVCAGIRLYQLAHWLPDTTLIRGMPNTPCVIREGMTVLAPGPDVSEASLAVAERIFTAVGRVRVLEESHMDAVTGLSGSGPAFVCVILEALADGGVMMGLPREVAVELAAQTMHGAARLVLETGEHPASLKDSVTTPAGCTIAALLNMEDGRIRSTLARTIQEATRVAAGLGQG